VTSPTFDLDADDFRVTDPCPDCGGIVRYNLTCHTWGGKPDGTGWRACLPCDSAFEFACALPDHDGDLLLDGCGWGYTWGLNPRNPRSVSNETRRPPWIAEGSMPDL
jgi:hypothetical protein